MNEVCIWLALYVLTVFVCVCAVIGCFVDPGADFAGGDSRYDNRVQHLQLRDTVPSCRDQVDE
jgi:hypothetical protein